MAKATRTDKARKSAAVGGTNPDKSGTAKVLVFAPEEGSLNANEMELQAAGCEVVAGLPGWHTPHSNKGAEMATMAAGADALMGTSIRVNPITRQVMAASENLRIIAKYTIGYDDIDVEAATELGIIVTHSPTEANWGGVAEGTMAMMLALLKKVRERDEAMKGDTWRNDALTGTYVGMRMQDNYPGITVGIIGLGRIGRRLTELLKPWRVRILACDPYCEIARFTLSGVERCSLETVLKEADVVSVHCTLNETTRKLINARTLAMMKPSAILLNAARGGIVDEDALAEALQNGTIAAAGLDAFDPEPLKPGSPLRGLGHKVLLSAHNITQNHRSGLHPGAVWARQNVLAALRGELPENIVNPDVLPRWKQPFIAKPLI